MSEQDDEIPTCDACHFPTRDLIEYPRSGFDPSRHDPDANTKRLCEICRHTGVGRLADLYGASHSVYENADVKRLIAYCTNVLLAALR